jgi:hypothetical protein
MLPVAETNLDNALEEVKKRDLGGLGSRETNASRFQWCRQSTLLGIRIVDVRIKGVRICLTFLLIVGAYVVANDPACELIPARVELALSVHPSNVDGARIWHSRRDAVTATLVKGLLPVAHGD